MGEVYSHLSEEERRVIQIGIGNGAGIRGIGLMPGRNASTVGGEAKRNTWVPVRRERVLPAAIAVSAGRVAFHAATGGGAGVAAGGRRVSRFPDGFPSPDARRGIRRRTARIAGPTGGVAPLNRHRACDFGQAVVYHVRLACFARG